MFNDGVGQGNGLTVSESPAGIWNLADRLHYSLTDRPEIGHISLT